jgi:hypothetical protein
MYNQKINTIKVCFVSHTVFWDRFNLYSLQSFLVLYLGAAFGFLDKASYTFNNDCITIIFYTYVFINSSISWYQCGFTNGTKQNDAQKECQREYNKEILTS